MSQKLHQGTNPVSTNLASTSLMKPMMTPKFLMRNLAVTIASLGLILSATAGAIAQTVDSPSPNAVPGNVPDAVPNTTPNSSSRPEIDTSVSREYEPAVVYLPDPQTQQLVPQSVLLQADEPVVGAVNQIMQSYQGQNVGIEGYEVNVDSEAHQAEINFNVNNPRGARAFESLSSANQFVIFEAIRETLLTQPVYSINQVIFLTNGVSFDI
jgi:hypothetical protein